MLAECFGCLSGSLGLVRELVRFRGLRMVCCCCGLRRRSEGCQHGIVVDVEAGVWNNQPQLGERISEGCFGVPGGLARSLQGVGGVGQVGFPRVQVFGCLLGRLFRGSQLRACICLAWRAWHDEVRGQRPLAYRAVIARLAPFSGVGGRVGTLDGLQRQPGGITFLCCGGGTHGGGFDSRSGPGFTLGLICYRLLAFGACGSVVPDGRQSGPGLSEAFTGGGGGGGEPGFLGLRGGCLLYQ